MRMIDLDAGRYAKCFALETASVNDNNNYDISCYTYLSFSNDNSINNSNSNNDKTEIIIMFQHAQYEVLNSIENGIIIRRIQH